MAEDRQEDRRNEGGRLLSVHYAQLGVSHAYANLTLTSVLGIAISEFVHGK